MEMEMEMEMAKERVKVRAKVKVKAKGVEAEVGGLARSNATSCPTAVVVLGTGLGHTNRQRCRA
jgi:hypothetical protein